MARNLSTDIEQMLSADDKHENAKTNGVYSQSPARNTKRIVRSCTVNDDWKYTYTSVKVWYDKYQN